MIKEERKKKNKRERNGLPLDVWTVKKSFVEMSPKSYLGLLDTLTKLQVPHELGEESMPSTRLGIISYATCSFSLWDVKYKVFNNSNCKWTTSKGAKGTRISNLVRDIFGKEGVWSISKRNFIYIPRELIELIYDICGLNFERF